MNSNEEHAVKACGCDARKPRHHSRSIRWIPHRNGKVVDTMFFSQVVVAVPSCAMGTLFLPTSVGFAQQ